MYSIGIGTQFGINSQEPAVSLADGVVQYGGDTLVIHRESIDVLHDGTLRVIATANKDKS